MITRGGKNVINHQAGAVIHDNAAAAHFKAWTAAITGAASAASVRGVGGSLAQTGTDSSLLFLPGGLFPGSGIFLASSGPAPRPIN